MLQTFDASAINNTKNKKSFTTASRCEFLYYYAAL